LITFKTIRWKNLLSTGNVWTEVKLNTTKTTLMIGENGSGKSTILDALTFALFGKPFRKINKPQLLNSVNGRDLLVELKFFADNHNYKIIRGMKPNIFEVYKDGRLIDQNSTTLDYQDFVNSHILKMTPKSFSQIVILGSASFVPFMQLTPADRRIVIEDLLDIQVFSVMGGIAKTKLQENKEQFQQNAIKLASTIETEELLVKNLKSSKENVAEKVAGLEANKTQYQVDIDRLTKEIEVLTNKKNALLDTTKDLPNLLAKNKELLALQVKIEHNITRHKKDVEFYDHSDTCPTCKQTIDGEFKATALFEAGRKITTISSALSDLHTKIDQTQRNITNLVGSQSAAQKLAEEIISKQSVIQSYSENIQSLTQTITRFQSDDQLIAQNTEALQNKRRELRELEAKKSDLLDDRQYLEVAVNLLKDGGIKSKIIKQYIPIINKQVNKYLTDMGFFVDFNMNENFEETIRSRYRDEFSYQNFSEGEKMRIDLAILFTWRKVARLKNSVNTNLLILDEIFDSSLDGNGVDDFLKIMLDLLDGTNTIVISHKTDALLDKFEKIIRFHKKGNFSSIIEDQQEIK